LRVCAPWGSGSGSEQGSPFPEDWPGPCTQVFVCQSHGRFLSILRTPASGYASPVPILRLAGVEGHWQVGVQADIVSDRYQQKEEAAPMNTAPRPTLLLSQAKAVSRAGLHVASRIFPLANSDPASLRWTHEKSRTLFFGPGAWTAAPQRLLKCGSSDEADPIFPTGCFQRRSIPPEKHPVIGRGPIPSDQQGASLGGGARLKDRGPACAQAARRQARRRHAQE